MRTEATVAPVLNRAGDTVKVPAGLALAVWEIAMLGGQDTFNRTLRLVEAWVPQKAYRHESKFQNELQAFLDEQLNDSGGSLLGLQEEYVVSREHGASRADVAVNGEVGIELKRDLTNSQTKKLWGQIEDYLDNYDYVIICACGIKHMDGWRKLKKKYHGGGFGAGLTEFKDVRFVHKQKSDFGKPQSSGSSGGWLDGFGFGI